MNGLLARSEVTVIVQPANLVRAAAAGDETAWNQLVDRHLRLVWSITRGYRLSDCDAGDVVQTVWMRLLENIDRVRDPDHIGGWLATTTRRECLRTIALRRRTSPVPQDDATLAALQDPDATELGAGIVREQAACAVHQALQRLPVRWRLLLELLMADDPPSYEEISRRLDMPVGSIGPTRGRALLRLRALLEPQGIY
jgi:RNA polymerase sigma factor (sigma-70 family)